MEKIKTTTKEMEKLNLNELKKEFAINDKNGEINTLNDLIGKKLNRRAYTIYWVNMAVAIILCLASLLFILSPILIWIYGHSFGSSEYIHALKIALIVGLPTLVITALYLGLVFWVLMVKCAHLEHDGHKIHLYLGVRSIVLCVDERIIAYCKYGWFTVPTASWCAELDDTQMIRFQLQVKNKYQLDINWYSESTYERYIEELHKIDGKTQKPEKRKDFVKDVLF